MLGRRTSDEVTSACARAIKSARGMCKDLRSREGQLGDLAPGLVAWDLWTLPDPSNLPPPAQQQSIRKRLGIRMRKFVIVRDLHTSSSPLARSDGYF